MRWTTSARGSHFGGWYCNKLRTLGRASRFQASTSLNRSCRNESSSVERPAVAFSRGYRLPTWACGIATFPPAGLSGSPPGRLGFKTLRTLTANTPIATLRNL